MYNSYSNTYEFYCTVYSVSADQFSVKQNQSIIVSIPVVRYIQIYNFQIN